ncbi:MAG: hypothetical protein ACPG5B_09845 [Chitinophagales bacterium]
MLTKVIDLISKSNDNNGKIALNLIKYLLTLVFSGIIYSWFFGSFELIPLKDFDEILKFCLSGNFIKPLLIFIIVWHLFYTVLELIISQYVISTVNFFAWLTKQLKVVKFDNSPKVLKIAYQSLFKALVRMSFFRYEGKILIIGYSFHKFKKIIKNAKEEKDIIDINFFIQCFIVILQLIVLLWILDLVNGNISFVFNLSVTLLLILSLIVIWYFIGIVLGIRMYAIPLYEEMLEMEKESENLLETLKAKQENNNEIPKDILESSENTKIE